ncbi:MAG: polysaccharide pyruvyl transferase family protein [Paraglaciecola sp.]|uniref:polysaccharide pyruvyl transferase family protein n=1 Tax=Paraglaciecola sp. TaxID=1920173 RepID=UPI003299A2D4
MNKIGIVNYQYSNHNYGAVLQAAALHFYINHTLGYESEHINFIPQGAKPKLKTKLKSIINRYLRDFGLKEKKIEHASFINPEIFEEFRQKWLPRSDNTYHSFEQIKQANLNYTHAIVGSDQVWRPSYADSSALVYFLAFLNNDVKKISYAASFGNDFWELNEQDTKKFADEVKQFTAVSVREISGVDICKNTFGVDAQHVLDPTLLVGRAFFDSVIGEAIPKGNSDIVFYKLDIDDKFEKCIEDTSSNFSFSNKNIYYSSQGRKYYYRPVSDWLSDIRESKLVITDSFHCVCFAILFEKPFLYYPNDNRGLARLESLLTLLGLENHIYRGDVDPAELAKSLMNIDYSEVNQKLAKLRDGSAKFLYDALA